jgi:uncharacterized membrane protein (DUF106 family)
VITVDGRNGTVSRNEEAATTAPASPSPGGDNTAPARTISTPLGEGGGEGSSTTKTAPTLDYRTPTTTNQPIPDPRANDTRIDRALVPPPPGRKERKSAKVRNLFLLIWGVYLAAAFLLPEHVLYQPSLSVLDFFLWPLVRAFGKPAAVAIIAGGMAALTMFGQKFWTDNARLLVAKRRAAKLNDEAFTFPKDSPRDLALRRLASPVQTRVVLASFVPLAVLLGPMVMTFMWLEPRVAPNAWNAPPGTPVRVIAMVKPDHAKTLTLSVPGGVNVVEPVKQNVPEVRRVLEKFRATELKQSDLSNLPWEMREPAEEYRRQRLGDLNTYLSDIPPFPVTWNITTGDKPGHWPVKVETDAGKSLTVDVVLGDAHPPAPAEIMNDSGQPLASVKVAYEPTSSEKPYFFAPFNKNWDWGWLGVYLLAYLPVMFLLRAVLKIA